MVTMHTEEPVHPAVWVAMGIPRLAGAGRVVAFQVAQRDSGLHHPLGVGGQKVPRAGHRLLGGELTWHGTVCTCTGLS